jgi:hypothetical protein
MEGALQRRRVGGHGDDGLRGCFWNGSLQRKRNKKGRRSGGAEGGQRGAARVYRAASVGD